MHDSGGPGGLFEPLKQKKVKNDKKNFPLKYSVVDIDAFKEM